MSEVAEAGAVLYHEPSIVTILIQSSFILALNIIDYILDKAIYCGLIGQILVGMAWGTPGADILGPDFQQAITDLGYLGLILIVFESGLSTNMKALRSNFVLSFFVALTGITLPIGLSFILIKMCNATTLQSFAAGCALSSTSLGTTFTILKSSRLDNSRLGVVLTSAAMLDDVVGLVLVQVISNLGASAGGNFSAVTVIRPIFVSIGYATIVPLLVYMFNKVGPKVPAKFFTPGKMATVLAPRQVRFVYYTALLIAAVASASYAGTSNLFAAYSAGLTISSGGDYKRSWHDTRKEEKDSSAKDSPEQEKDSPKTSATNNTNKSWKVVAAKSTTSKHKDAISEATHPDPTPGQADTHKSSGSGSNSRRSRSMNATTRTNSTSHTNTDTKPNVYEAYYATPVNNLLKDFFFGSIGLSIPIRRLFDAPTLWRGLVFSLLMALGKLACGLWLVRFSSSPPTTRSPSLPDRRSNLPKKIWTTLLSYKPQSLYPAGILGNALVARGEIGFLIPAIAQANGIFESDQQGQGDLFLIVTWAILICTIVGPISVELLTRRMKRLRWEVGDADADADAGAGGIQGRGDPLGVWADL